MFKPISNRGSIFSETILCEYMRFVFFPIRDCLNLIFFYLGYSFYIVCTKLQINGVFRIIFPFLRKCAEKVF